MANQKTKQDRKKLWVRVVCLALAVLLVLSVCASIFQLI